MRLTCSLAVLLLATTAWPARAQTTTGRQPVSSPPQRPPVGALGADGRPAAETLPATVPELLALLRTRHDEVRDQLGTGQTSTVHLPALAAKDVALALEDRVAEIPAAFQGAAVDAVQRVLLAAWQMDAAADTGDLEKVTQAYEQFSTAVSAVTAAYAFR